MLEEVLVLLLLTILFTCNTVIAFSVRKHLRGGCGQSMYLLWLAVMLAAIIPMQVAPPIVNVIVSERTVTEVEPPYRDKNPEIVLITDASRVIRQGELPVLRAHLTAYDDPVIADTGDSVAFNVSGFMVAMLRFMVFVWAVGFSYCLIRELIEYRDIRRFLDENSDPVTDEDMLALYHLCGEQIRLRRNLPLRRIREDFPMTPCAVGFFRPTVFLSAFCDDMDASHLANIFTHELCHVKRGDMLYKLLMVLTASVHWFNPISLLLKAAVTEDLEMACDASVLRYRKNVSVRDYMESILCVAERVRRERQARRQCEPMFRAAFFMANDTTPSYLKRRYLHMKTTREKKNLKTVYSISAGVLALICAANVAVLSSCSYVEAADDTFAVGTAAEEPYLYDPIETAFANYFCVPDYDAITDEQFAQIESVDVYLVMPQMSDTATVQAYGSAIPPQDEDLYPAAYVSINGKPVEMLMPCVLEKDVFENQIVPGLHAWDEEVGAKDVYIKRLQAFYCIKDPADPELEERAVAEMQALFPITKTTPVALYDPYSTKREDHYLYQILFETGMVNDAAFSDTALHAKLGSIPALDDAQITVTVAETLNDFAVDSGLFKDQSQSFKDYMSAYMDANQKKAEELSELIAAEYAQQMDINGNGIIGE